MSSDKQVERPQLLISICNVYAESTPRPSSLLRMDILTRRTEWIDVGLSKPPASGFGICLDDRYVYHLSILEFVAHLIVLDRQTLQVVHVQRLEEIAFGHSMVRYGDDLCVASTGTDEIIAYRMDGHEASEARSMWTPTASGADTHHINSLAVVNGELLCSAFGSKEGDSWATATNGYIRNVTRDMPLFQGLRQPHTVTWHAEKLYFCHSQLGTVNCGEDVKAHLYGYSRGLAFGPDGAMYAGTSVARRPLHNLVRPDFFGNTLDPGELHGRCAVVQFSPKGLRTEIGLSQLGDEIYDVVLL